MILIETLPRAVMMFFAALALAAGAFGFTEALIAWKYSATAIALRSARRVPK